MRSSPGVKPLRYLFVADFLPGLQFGNPSVNLSKLPLFGVNVRCNSLRGQERFRAFRAFGKRAQALLSLGINPYGEGLGHHMCAPVYMFAQMHSSVPHLWAITNSDLARRTTHSTAR